MDSKPEHCERCGLEWPWLECHHVIPQSQGGKDGPTMWLCQNCHEDLQGPHGRAISMTPEAKAMSIEHWKAWYEGDPANKERRADAVRASHERGERKHVSALTSAWHKDNPEANAERIRKIKETKRRKRDATL